MYQRNVDFETDLATAKDPGASAETLEQLLGKHHGEMAIAEAVASNPACSYQRFTSFWKFLQSVAATNPKASEHQAHAHWHQNALREPRNRYSRWGRDVSERHPQLYVISYLMIHGDGAYQRYIMGLDNIPEALVRQYASDKSAPLRKVIAARSDLPDDLFAQLGADRAKTVRQVVAGNHHAPASVLAELTTDKEALVASAAQANPSCPDEAVHQARLTANSQPISSDGSVTSLDRRQAAALSYDPDCPSDKLGELAKHADPCVRFAAGLNPNTAPKTLDQLAHDELEWVRACAAFNPNTSTSTLEKLSSSNNSDVQLGLASNPSLSEAAQIKHAGCANERAAEALANLTDYDSVRERLIEEVKPVKKAADKTWRHFLKEALAARKTGKFGGLQRGYASRYLFVSRIAARSESCPDNLACFYAHYCFDDYSRNPNATLALLEGKTHVRPTAYQEWKIDKWLGEAEAPGHVARFYIRSDHEKRRAQAVSSWTTPLLELLPFVFDDNTNTRKRLARRPDLIRYQFEMLARDDKPGVREEIAKNKRTPKTILAELAGDKATTVRTVAAKRVPKAAAGKQAGKRKATANVANQGSATERARLAKRTEDGKILTDLAADRAASVRTAVAENSHTPTAVLAQLAGDSQAKVRVVVAARMEDIALRRKLLTDPDKAVRLAAARNYRWRTWQRSGDYLWNEDFLGWIADSEDEEIRAICAQYAQEPTMYRKFIDDTDVVTRKLALNKHLDLADKLVLAKKSDDQDTVAALANKTEDEELFLIAAGKITSSHADDPIRCHREMLSRPSVQDIVCTHPLVNVRVALVRQKTLTSKALEALKNDPNEWIRDSVAERNS